MVLISVRLLSVLITFLAQLKHLALGALVKITADHSPVGDEDSAVEPASSVEHEIVDPGGGADDNVPVAGSSILLGMNWTTPAVGLLMTTPVVGPSLLRMLIPP